MILTLRRNLLKWAVGREMFCKLTGTLLDARQAVLVEFRGAEDRQTTLVVTGEAYDTQIAPKLARFLASGLTIEVHDGRDLFSKDAAKQESGWKLYEPVTSEVES